MACDIKISLSEESKAKAKEGLDAFAKRLKDRTASIVIDPRTGAMAIRGWRAADIGMSDACALRRIANSPATRGIYMAALREAEKIAGRKVNPAAVAAGHHSHDGGNTWGPGH